MHERSAAHSRDRPRISSTASPSTSAAPPPPTSPPTSASATSTRATTPTWPRSSSNTAATCSSPPAARAASRPICRASGTNRSIRPGTASTPATSTREMNYWPALTTNLAECQEPLVDAIDELAVSGPVGGQGPLRRPRLGRAPQLRSLARRGADQRLEPRHLGRRRGLALPAPLGAIPVHRRQGVPRQAGLSGHEGAPRSSSSITSSRTRSPAT